MENQKHHRLRRQRYIHTASHKHHLEVLDLVLQRLNQHNLKSIWTKCFFGNTKVAYLGLVLTSAHSGRHPTRERETCNPQNHATST